MPPITRPSYGPGALIATLEIAGTYPAVSVRDSLAWARWAYGISVSMAGCSSQGDQDPKGTVPDQG